jgi:hypothetical protein
MKAGAEQLGKCLFEPAGGEVFLVPAELMEIGEANFFTKNLHIGFSIIPKVFEEKQDLRRHRGE